MTEETGRFPQLRKNGVWLPISLVGIALTMAVAWGTNVNRLAVVEQQLLESRQQRERMEEHIETNDRAIAVIQSQMQAILEQLRALNAKLDRDKP